MSADGSVYLLRHGEAMNNVEPGIIFGRGEGLPLTEKGQEQAEQLGDILRSKGIIPDCAYSSGELRARKTAERVMQSIGIQIDVDDDDRLLELHAGDWTGRNSKDIFTAETTQLMEASGKDFRPPQGESMNDVGMRMLRWMDEVCNPEVAKGRTVFAFTHGGPIRSLVSYVSGWSHAQTYETQPAHTSATIFKQKNGLWVPGEVGQDPNELDSELIAPTEISFRLSENEIIREHLESVIWFGSMRNKQDVHKDSDFDVQIILDEPTTDLIIAVNDILKDYPTVDLSIMYLKDIFDRKGNVIFHDGTKGMFFMHVLAEGKILYGKNMYKDIVSRLTLDEIRPSMMPTIREYISRLRVMAIQSPNDTRQFKKYSLKFFKDVLVFSGNIPLDKMTSLDNESARDVAAVRYCFSAEAEKALAKINDFETNYSGTEMANLLTDYENIVEELCND